jgi:catechol 2,3-dioxygenase
LESLDDLKEFYRHAKAKGVAIDHIADHGISLGIYMRDPDGNGVEVFYEMPREQWPSEDRIFAMDHGRGRFPGPWDPELAAQQAAAQ